MTVRIAATTFFALLGASGCAAPQAAPQIAATPSPPADAVAQAAALLAEADNPMISSTKRAAIIGALDRLGMTRAAGSDDDPVARWRAEAVASGHAEIPLRGRALGPAYRSGWLEAGGNTSLDQLFLAGQTAVISLSSTDRRPIAITISDPDSKIVCQQGGPPPGRCKWLALYTQRYRIELSNPGQTRLRYFLVTN